MGIKLRHSGKDTTFSVMNKMVPPIIIVDRTSAKWIEECAAEHDTEVGVLGVVDIIKDNKYRVRDIFYPKHQEANGGTCEISPEGSSDIAYWMIDREREDDIAKIRFWGHSHINMPTGPSGQDEKQALAMVEDAKDFFIRAIFNKKGEMTITFFDYINMVRFDNVKWTLEEKISDEIITRKISLISGVISDTNVPSTERLKKVNKIMSEDEERSAIREKIKRLKEINIPSSSPGDKNRSSGHVSNDGLGSKKNGQPNMFDGVVKPPGSFREESLYFPEGVDFPPRISKEDADQIIKNWDVVTEKAGG